MPFKFNPFTKKLDITDVANAGATSIDSITPNSGTNPVVPDANGLLAMQATGSITNVGGTNSLTTQLTGLTNHTVLVGAGTATITKVGPGSAGQVLQSGGASADPAFSTATYPSTATGTGTLLRANGTNWAATTTTYPTTNAINTLLYASSANVMSALATANNGVLITSGTGVPSIGTAPIAAGGTNATSMATSLGIVKYDGTRLVTSTATIDSSNRYINASQPASQGYVFATLTDATGDGTEFTVTYGQEAYDQTSNLNAATGVFTAPIAGFYLVNFQVCLGDIGAAHTAGSLILDLASGFGSVSETLLFNPFAISSSGQASVNINSVFKMQASGTITGKVTVSGGTKTVDVLGVVGGRSVSFLNAVLLWGF